jgi:hypothetical protein
VLILTAVIAKSSSQSTDLWKNPATFIALASAIVALASAVYTASYARTAKKTYRLMVEQDARRNPHLIPYLSDAYIHTSKTGAEAAISITVTNPSDIDNSIARIELLIKYRRDKDRGTVIKIPPSDHVTGLPLKSENLLQIPRGISSHQIVAGWLAFIVPEWITHGSLIDSYSLSIYDSHGEIATLTDLTLRQSFESLKEHESYERKEEQGTQAAEQTDC